MVLTCFEASRFLRQSKSGGFWLIEFDRGPFGGPLPVELEIIFEFVLGGVNLSGPTLLHIQPWFYLSPLHIEFKNDFEFELDPLAETFSLEFRYMFPIASVQKMF